MRVAIFGVGVSNLASIPWPLYEVLVQIFFSVGGVQPVLLTIPVPLNGCFVWCRMRRSASLRRRGWGKGGVGSGGKGRWGEGEVVGLGG